jgi:hypothetical protein
MTPTAKKRTIHNRGLAAKLTTHFTQHPGEHLAGPDLAAEFGVNEATIKASMAGVIYRNSLPGLATVVRGNVWAYKPNEEPSKSTKRILEEVGQTKGGTLILQDEDGNLYAAKPLEVQ